MTNRPSKATLDRLADVVGPKGVMQDVREQEPYLKEWRDRWHGATPLLLRPKNTEEVSRILAIAIETETTIVPQSGNTGLVGGQIPTNGEVLVSLDRMTRVMSVDAVDYSITVEAGATLRSVQDAAAAVDRFFPLSLASEGSCRIGGNLSTNAGGLNVLAYGNARELCLGLEVVLADGRVLNLQKSLRKDNTGYDLKHIFIGAEGTLGIITAATLKLFPRPQRYETAFAALHSVEAALKLLSLAKLHSGNRVVGFELMPELGIQFAVKHMNNRRPIDTVAPWYVLFEIADAQTGTMQTILEVASESGDILDATIAQNDTQRNELWSMRENLSESQKYEGGSIKHDVSVPISALPAFIAEAATAVERFMPESRLCCFGHMGDGNMHFNVSQPVGMDKQKYLSRWHEMNRIVHDVVKTYQGSFGAEHGIGVLKREDMLHYKSAIELDVMRSLKHALDPKGILNPGRVLP